VWASLPGAELVGVFDVDSARAREVAERHGCPAFEQLSDLLCEAAALSVAVPTVDHHRVVRDLLEEGKHVLVEKPITTTLGEADDLIERAVARGVVLQVGHIERFNPAVEMLRAAVEKPRFIEVHRLASFSPRSLDIDVVLDLMIHDLDIVLALDGSEAVQVDAVGIPVLTSKFDIANARLRFASGLIANLTASRISTEKLRKFRVWAPRTYVSADLAARGARVFRLIEEGDGLPRIVQESRSAPDQEPLRGQLASFLETVRTGARPRVSGADGRQALELAHTVLSRMSAADI
jgi:predicted dehydrogenase